MAAATSLLQQFDLDLALSQIKDEDSLLAEKIRSEGIWKKLRSLDNSALLEGSKVTALEAYFNTIVMQAYEPKIGIYKRADFYSLAFKIRFTRFARDVDNISEGIVVNQTWMDLAWHQLLKDKHKEWATEIKMSDDKMQDKLTAAIAQSLCLNPEVSTYWKEKAEIAWEKYGVKLQYDTEYSMESFTNLTKLGKTHHGKGESIPDTIVTVNRDAIFGYQGALIPKDRDHNDLMKEQGELFKEANNKFVKHEFHPSNAQDEQTIPANALEYVEAMSEHGEIEDEPLLVGEEDDELERLLAIHTIANEGRPDNLNDDIVSAFTPAQTVNQTENSKHAENIPDPKRRFKRRAANEDENFATATTAMCFRPAPKRRAEEDDVEIEGPRKKRQSAKF